MGLGFTLIKEKKRAVYFNFHKNKNKQNRGTAAGVDTIYWNVRVQTLARAGSLAVKHGSYSCFHEEHASPPQDLCKSGGDRRREVGGKQSVSKGKR